MMNFAAAAGVLHHLDEFDVQVLDHGPVDSAHLVGGQCGDCAAANGMHRLSFPVFCPLALERKPPEDLTRIGCSVRPPSR
jgi:hypothetical protein